MKRSSRSPRRTDFTHTALQAQTFDTSKPAPGSRAWRLWQDGHDLAEQALATAFVQGIANGDLHPERYGHYTVQDIAYCHHAQQDYRTVVERATKAGLPDLAAFAQARFESYQRYNAELGASWHITGVEAAITPSPAVQRYIDFERHVANQLPPIYGILAMIPCEQLWAWLASTLAADTETDTDTNTGSGSGNLYAFWITDNDDWHGAYRLDNFVDGWFDAHPAAWDRDTARWVVRSGLTCEVNGFRAACDEPLLAMPSPPAGV